MDVQIKDTADQDVLLSAPKFQLSATKISALIGVLILAALAVGIYYWSDLLSTDHSLSRADLRIATVTRGELRKEIAALGKIVIANSPTLYSSAEGVVTYAVNAGDVVKLGDVLLSIDSPTLDSQLQQEKSSLSRLESDLARQKLSSQRNLLNVKQAAQRAEIAHLTAQRTHDRYKIGYKNQFISRSEYERSEDELLLAELELKQAPDNIKLEEAIATTEIQNARSQLQRQQWIVDELERRKEELNITSPVDGIVGNIALNQKSAVSLFQPLITVVDLSRYEAEIDIPEHYAPEVTPDMAVEIKSNGKVYAGKVIAVSPEIVGGQVKLRLDFAGEAPDHLRQNQRISANILLEVHDQVLRLPRGNYLDSNNGRDVFRIAGNKAQKVPVKLGVTSMDQVEIVAGLSVGDEIIVSDTASYKHAELIHLNN